MRRITYISRFEDDLDDADIAEIEQSAYEYNRSADITGFLIRSDGVFFQVLEGDDMVVQELFERIRVDPRHHDVLCLENEVGELVREFPRWSMQSIDLTRSTDLLMKPIRLLSNTLNHTHLILERYTQRRVLRYLADGVDPTTVEPERSVRLVAFADIMGFSSLSAVLEPEETLDLANQFLTLCSEALRAHGGEIHKLIGDSVMASFDESAADDALAFAVDLQHRLSVVRRDARPEDPASVLFGGVGIGAGMVVIGNVGTPTSLDFTLLGDAVNRASHLESLTRETDRRLAFSERVRAATRRAWGFVDLGDHELKGTGSSRAYSIDDEAVERDPHGSDDSDLIRRYIEERGHLQ